VKHESDNIANELIGAEGTMTTLVR